jgi:hypothetical protein
MIQPKEIEMRTALGKPAHSISPAPRGAGAETKMANHPNRTWAYAVQSPRGFSNELTVHAFATAADRDAWVAQHEDDGDVNSAALGARAITAKQAAGIMHDRGDAATRTYNALTAHGEAKNCPLALKFGGC